MANQPLHNRANSVIILPFLMVVLIVSLSIVIKSVNANSNTQIKRAEKISPLNTREEKKPKLGLKDSVMEYIYNAPESVNDKRYQYHWEILRTALEKTKDKYGAYEMTEAKFMNEKRQLFELKNSTNELTVMCLSTTPELEKDLFPIRIPVDKNLASYFILLVRKDNLNKMHRIRTLSDFRKLSIGLGYGWIDVDILKADSFKVITGSNYEGLFKMLANKRFDAFSRSALEILDEIETHKDHLKDVTIEDSLLLYYPLPMYFWFSKNENGKKLATRAREGMEKMLDDGTYDKIFFAYHGYKTKQLHLKERRIFKIENPYLVMETPFADKRLWYDPINEK